MQFGQIRQENPVSKYLKYKGGEFTYRDKDSQENKVFILDEFIVLKTGYLVKGYSSEHEIGVRSNEVEYLNEAFLVKTFKNKKGKEYEIAAGTYKNIKGDLPSGVVLHKCLTVLHGDEIIHISFKGNAMWVISETLKMIDISKVKIKYIESKLLTKKGVKYSSPIFGIGGEINESEFEIAISKLGLINELSKKSDTDDEDTFVDDLLAEAKPDKKTQEMIDDGDFPF